MRKSILAICLFISLSTMAQHHYDSSVYIPDPSALVREKVEQWQDLKFGLMMHWGPYSQWGIVESWSLCPEDYDWCRRTKGSNPDDYYTYKKEYEGLKNTFNPTEFDPERWAAAAKNAGMKYVVFTTKHHDGFTMYDSKYTDYKVTDKDCPFHSNPKADIAKEVFDSFRAQGLWAGAYFSKPDWHHDSYWDPQFPPQDRNANYDPLVYPEKWNKFVEFTHNQVVELVRDYGKLDLVWFDGGWVRKRDSANIEMNYRMKLEESKMHGFIKHRVVDQDLRMDELVEKMRSVQPDVLVVDRHVPGKNENYMTPENRVPEKALPYPWESCIISGGGWSYTPDAKYIDARKGIHMLVDIVAKGGNLLLNIAPSPEGEWQQGAYDLLSAYGDWLKVNGDAIYNTRAIAPFKEENICMTQGKEGEVYFIYLDSEDNPSIPSELLIKSKKPKKGAKITLLGHNKRLKWKSTDNGFKVMIPESVQNNGTLKYAWAIKVSAVTD